MRGYLSFLLVFASVFLILNLIAASEQPEKISFSKAIAAERAYAAQMNAKEAVMEAIRQGGAYGYYAYNATHDQQSCEQQYYGQCLTEPPGPGCAVYISRCFKYNFPPEADASVASAALGFLSALDTSAFDKGMSVTIQCGGAGTGEDAERMVGSGRCGACDNITGTVSDVDGFINDSIAAVRPYQQDGHLEYPQPVQAASCADALIPRFGKGMGPDANPALANVTLGKPIVIIVRYPAFNITAVSYIPAGYQVYP